jgi:hypothetical protein
MHINQSRSDSTSCLSTDRIQKPNLDGHPHAVGAIDGHREQQVLDAHVLLQLGELALRPQNDPHYRRVHLGPYTNAQSKHML